MCGWRVERQTPWTVLEGIFWWRNFKVPGTKVAPCSLINVRSGLWLACFFLFLEGISQQQGLGGDFCLSAANGGLLV
jgi:hypothetical protein